MSFLKTETHNNCLWEVKFPKIAKLFVCYQATAIAIYEAPSRGPLLQLLHGTIAVCSDQKAWEVVHSLGPLSSTWNTKNWDAHILAPCKSPFVYRSPCGIKKVVVPTRRRRMMMMMMMMMTMTKGVELSPTYPPYGCIGVMFLLSRLTSVPKTPNPNSAPKPLPWLKTPKLLLLKKYKFTALQLFLKKKQVQSEREREAEGKLQFLIPFTKRIQAAFFHLSAALRWLFSPRIISCSQPRWCQPT